MEASQKYGKLCQQMFPIIYPQETLERSHNIDGFLKDFLREEKESWWAKFLSYFWETANKTRGAMVY